MIASMDYVAPITTYWKVDVCVAVKAKLVVITDETNSHEIE